MTYLLEGTMSGEEKQFYVNIIKIPENENDVYYIDENKLNYSITLIEVHSNKTLYISSQNKLQNCFNELIHFKNNYNIIFYSSKLESIVNDRIILDAYQSFVELLLAR